MAEEEAVHSISIDCECPTESIPVRQGDILIGYVNGHALSSPLYVVINADCDIAQGKTSGKIALLHIIRIKTYIRETWAAKKLERFAKRHMENLSQLVERFRLESDPESYAISDEALTNWIIAQDADVIANELTPGNTEKANQLQHRIEKGRGILLQLRNPHSDSFDKLTTVSSIDSGRPLPEEFNRLKKSATQELRRLPDDAFFIAEIPGVDGMGHVALLRSMQVLDLNYVTTSATTARQSEGSWYCRTARLKPAYKYGLAQKFSWMYARVGLPSDIEIAHELTLDNVEL